MNSYILVPADLNIRLALRIWDGFATSAKDFSESQPVQPIEEGGEIKSLLEILALIIKIFEVVNFHLLDGLPVLTASGSSTIASVLANDSTTSDR